MKSKIFSYVFLYLLVLVSNIFSAWKDTGFIQWNQPNGVTFIARLYGDEFENWMITQGNYQIVRSSNGWYYYAVLGTNGDFIPSTVRVGIDAPLQSSLNLQRSQARLIEIQNERIAFNQNLVSSPNSPGSTDLNLAIVLVDFSPILRDTLDRPNGKGYNYSSFSNMFFSNGTYTGTSPDNEQVFGSIRDYYWEQTGNRYTVIGEIINATNPSNPAKPLWLTLPNSIDYYASHYSKITILEFLYDQTLLTYPELADYYNIGFIYGGDMYGGTFWPHCYAVRSKRIHIMSEKYNGTFAHIGTHCHELGHSFFSLSDQYDGNTVDPREYDLMSLGLDNGPTQKGQCPAPISAIDKYRKGFYGELYNIVLGSTDYSIFYGSVNSNKLYKVSIPNSNEYFILECRRRQGFNIYTPNYTYSNEIGVYLWHANPNSIFDMAEIVYADNNYSLEDNSFPKSSLAFQDFTNFSVPNSRKRDASYSNVAIQNIRVIGVNPNTAYCKVDVLDEVPLAPVISISGNWGQNPTLSWTIHGETDINHYILKKYYVFDDGTTSTMYVDPATSPYTDYNVVRDKNGDLAVYYSVKTVDNSGNHSVYSDQVSTAGQSNWKRFSSDSTFDKIERYQLLLNYPNPFNPSTKISYSIKDEGLVILKVYDVLGKEVATLVNENKPEGNYEVEFNASQLPSGMYIYKLQAGSFSDVKKMLLTK